MRITRDDVGGRYQAAILADPGLVAYWPLDERVGIKARDYRGGNVGTYTGGIVLGYPQVPLVDTPGAIDLNGTTGYVNVPTATAIDLGDGPLSIEAWINSDTFASIRAVVGKGSNAGMMFVNAAGNLVLSKRFVADIVASTLAMVAGRWYHCLATKNAASTCKLYIDGVEVTGTVTNQTLAATASDLAIGSEIGGSATSVFDGKIAHVALYKRVLTLSDARHHNALGRGL